MLILQLIRFREQWNNRRAGGVLVEEFPQQQAQVHSRVPCRADVLEGYHHIEPDIRQLDGVEHPSSLQQVRLPSHQTICCYSSFQFLSLMRSEIDAMQQHCNIGHHDSGTNKITKH